MKRILIGRKEVIEKGELQIPTAFPLIILIALLLKLLEDFNLKKRTRMTIKFLPNAINERKMHHDRIPNQTQIPQARRATETGEEIHPQDEATINTVTTQEKVETTDIAVEKIRSSIAVFRKSLLKLSEHSTQTKEPLTSTAKTFAD